VILRRIARVVAVLAALFSAACGLIVADGLRDRPGRADVIVVLGSLVRSDGTPTAGLAARIDRGLGAWRSGLAPRIIVSGGLDRSGWNEAPVMRRYLLDRGVPDSCILVDPRGQNTWLTARNTRAWLDAHALRRALVVSEYYHLPRCRLAFARHGLPGVFTLHARHGGLLDLYATAREVPALIKYALRRDR
jgi:uncharacterized SAM-binding protein YcdF (DUF218 family)